ncbi:OprO/OprP family phosphate-selective porin [Paraglaciecola sp. 20A4]|uniref:OprO/OprP family phosphate-selective porin n=1 Tax=Paraglaciecola sp. 20A4 TaxID=2687288 RepID=UPI001F0D1B52|nr:OprO/OprP family phosphate-selective porin [Paraglaciecola sp. 20A4]
MQNKIRRPLRTLFYLLLLNTFNNNSVFASEDMFKFSGFATLGAIYNDSNDLGFHTNFKTPARSGFSFAPDSLIGAQANIEFNAQWDAVVQAVYRDKLDDKVLNYLDVAFLRYHLDNSWEIRAGRMNTDIYFLSEYKSVGYAYLWARPPSEFYGKVSSVSQFEGADVLYKRSFGDGFLQIKLGFGESDATVATIGSAFDIHFTNMMMASLTYQQDNWQVRASLLDTKVDEFSASTRTIEEAIALFPPTIWPGGPELRDRLSFVGKKQQFFGLGYQYDNDLWLVQSEVGFIDSEWDLERDTVSGYISVGYQPENITYYATISAVRPTKNNVSDDVGEISPSAPEYAVAIIQSFQPLIRKALDQNLIKQHTFSVGAKWQLSPSLVAKLQVDYSIIANNNFSLWRLYNEPDSGQEVTVSSLNLNWIF